MNSPISEELFYVYVDFVMYLILCTCLLMEQIFTENNTITFWLAVNQVRVMMLPKLMLALCDGFQYCFLLLFTSIISTKKENN